MSEYSLSYIIVSGNAAVGYSYVGPFDNEEDAEKEIAYSGDYDAEDEIVVIAELHEPVFKM